MSLEDALTRHATAVEKLAEAITSLNTTAAGALATGSLTGMEKPPEALVPTPGVVTAGPRPRGRPPGSGAQAAAVQAATAAQPAQTAEAPGIKYDTVREAVLKLAENRGHQVAVAVLAKFGAKNGKDLKPAQYAEVLKAIQVEQSAVA